MFRLLLILLLWAAPAQAAVLFMSGAETGTVTGITGEFNHHQHQNCSQGTVTADTTTVRTGAYSLKVVSGGHNDVRFGSVLNDWYIRAYIYMTAYPSSDTNVWETLDSGTCGSETRRLRVWIRTDGTFAWSLLGGGYVATGATPLPLNQWNLLETRVRAHASAGGVELKLNNITEFTSLGTDTSAIGSISISFGPRDGGGQSIYYDDIQVSNSAYPGPGRIITRQGLAGTPTYDVWTKSGCATSDVCWSDTPFGTGTNTNWNVSGTDKQTMLVESFSVTQAGHGTQVITDSDTISTAKIVYVMDCGAGTCTTDGMRRVAGVDTFISIGRNDSTTGDYCYASIDASGNNFVPSLANLNSMEAGVRHNTDTLTTTIYDVWVMVDYCEGCAVAGTSYKHKVRQN
jgi:hypothetical protein